jgi:hypothetical protein
MGGGRMGDGGLGDFAQFICGVWFLRARMIAGFFSIQARMGLPALRTAARYSASSYTVRSCQQRHSTRIHLQTKERTAVRMRSSRFWSKGSRREPWPW